MVKQPCAPFKLLSFTGRVSSPILTSSFQSVFAKCGASHVFCTKKNHSRDGGVQPKMFFFFLPLTSGLFLSCSLEKNSARPDFAQNLISLRHFFPTNIIFMQRAVRHSHTQKMYQLARFERSVYYFKPAQLHC